jgi:outer membrane lipoprotein SlyB
MMKSILAATALTVTLTGCVNAQTQDQFTFVRVQHIQPYHSVASVDVPTTQCNIVNVPVYSHRNSGSGNVLSGMVVGGIVGNAIGGNDKSTALGAIIGGLAAADPIPYVSGYRQEQQCRTVYIQQLQQVHAGYTVTYIHQNVSGVVQTPFYFQPGSVVSIRELTTGN